MDILQIILLSLIEGITEFLPISSTGHLIIFSHALGITNDPFVQHFNIIIQAGAILAVLFLYPRRFFSWNPKFFAKILASFLPTAIIGFLLKGPLESLLNSLLTVATSLVLGGVALIFFDKKDSNHTGVSVEELTLKKAVIIGLLQSLALIPGVSRAGAAIIAGLVVGMHRKAATEYSFFLGVPTLLAASGYKMLKYGNHFTSDQILQVGLGLILSFVFAAGGIKLLIRVVSRYGLYHFGWYRIVLGVIIISLVVLNSSSTN